MRNKNTLELKSVNNQHLTTNPYNPRTLITTNTYNP